jgi:hypothetical protein
MDVLHEVADKVTEAIVDLSTQVEEFANHLEGIQETLTGIAESLVLLVAALEARSVRATVPSRPSAPPEDGWQPIDTAPRTGEPIEIRNVYGPRPWYGLFRWQGESWQNAQKPALYIARPYGNWLTWRPYTGTPEEYEDPTRGAQDTPQYWR